MLDMKSPFEHITSLSAEGEKCGICYRLHGDEVPATHKVGEEIFNMPGEQPVQIRHNFTGYVCCDCFGDIFGPTAKKWCAGELTEKAHK